MMTVMEKYVLQDTAAVRYEPTMLALLLFSILLVAVPVAAADSLPIRFNPQPTGTLPADTPSVTISLQTGVDATCRYSIDTTGVAYDDMPHLFATTGSTTHGQPITGLRNGEGYNFYVRCRDTAGNINHDDFAVSFNVAGDNSGGGRLDKVLFIGNSYTGHSGGVFNHFHRLMAASGRTVDVAGEIHGGEAFSRQNDNYPGHVNRPEVSARIAGDAWDAVVLQGGLSEGFYDDGREFYEAGTTLIRRVRANHSEPVLFMIWGYENYENQRDMYRELYESLGEQTATPVAPIGLGIHEAKKKGLNVYSDGSHLSLDGAYLAGAMFFAFFTGESPQGLSYHGYSWNDTLTAAEAGVLQELAWKVVSEYGVFYGGSGNTDPPAPAAVFDRGLPWLLLLQ